MTMIISPMINLRHARVIETHKDHFTISTDPAKLDIAAITDMLTRAYWAKGRTRDAHELYSQYGWKPPAHPETWMEIFNG